MKDTSIFIMILGLVCCIVGVALWIFSGSIEIAWQAHRVAVAGQYLLCGGAGTIVLGLFLMVLAEIRDELREHTRILAERKSSDKPA